RLDQLREGAKDLPVSLGLRIGEYRRRTEDLLEVHRVGCAVKLRQRIRPSCHDYASTTRMIKRNENINRLNPNKRLRTGSGLKRGSINRLELERRAVVSRFFFPVFDQREVLTSRRDRLRGGAAATTPLRLPCASRSCAQNDRARGVG